MLDRLYTYICMQLYRFAYSNPIGFVDYVGVTHLYMVEPSDIGEQLETQFPLRYSLFLNDSTPRVNTYPILYAEDDPQLLFKTRRKS